MLDAAAELFANEGYTATTIARVARAADVSVELVSSSFGSKGALLMEAVRRVSYRDQLSLRDSVLALDLASEPDPERRVEAVVDLACSILPSMAPLVPVMHRAADEDVEARAAWIAARERHAETCTLIVDLLAPAPPGPDAVDEVYTALLSENYLAFVDDRGWGLERYAAWLRRTLAAAVAPVSPASPA